MGLFNFDPNLDDPKTQMLVSMGLSLLGGAPNRRKNFGADLAYAGANGMGAYQGARQYQMQQQAMERQNRASDLQQLQGAYSFLRQQELPKMLAQGQNYVPPPELGQMESRIGQLLDLGNLSGGIKSAPTGPAPATMPSAPMPAAAPPASPSPSPQPSASPNPQPTGMGGPAAGVPMATWLTVDPTGKMYLDALQKQATPISTRYGVYTIDQNHPSRVNLAGGMVPPNAMPINVGPNGPSIGPLPGQLETQKAIVNAAEAGKAPYDIKMVTDASGAQVPVSVAQLVEKRAAQAPAPAVPGTSFSGQAPAQSAPQQDPFAGIPKRYVPQGLGQSTFDKEMAAKQAESASSVAAKLGTQADMANQRIALNTQALDMVDQADTGPRAAQIGDVKNWLVSRFGIPESSFNNTPSATIALQKDLLNAATQKAKQQFGSRITQSEVMLMLSRGAPNVDMTKASIKFLLNSDNALLGYQVKQANDFGTYLQKGGDPMRFEAWYAKQFPASRDLGAVQMNPQSNIEALVNKYRSH